MKPVTKEELSWLLRKNILKRSKGGIINLTVTNKQSKSSYKQYYVPDYVADKIPKGNILND